MPAPDDSDFSAEEFAEKLEAGDFDGRVHEELKKLSHDQLLEVANISMRLRKAKADEASLNRPPPKKPSLAAHSSFSHQLKIVIRQGATAQSLASSGE